MFKRPSIFLALAGMIGLTLLVFKLRKPEPPPVPLVEPSRAPYADSIGARGLVESVDENVRIAPNLPGLIAEVFVKVGDRVKKEIPSSARTRVMSRRRLSIKRHRWVCWKQKSTRRQ